jgi:hypothetical protein
MENMEWVPPKPRLQGGGVAIRPFRASDAAAVASACRDPDILRFTFMKDGLTEGEAGEWIADDRRSRCCDHLVNCGF